MHGHVGPRLNEHLGGCCRIARVGPATHYDGIVVGEHADNDGLSLLNGLPPLRSNCVYQCTGVAIYRIPSLNNSTDNEERNDQSESNDNLEDCETSARWDECRHDVIVRLDQH